MCIYVNTRQYKFMPFAVCSLEISTYLILAISFCPIHELIGTVYCFVHLFLILYKSCTTGYAEVHRQVFMFQKTSTN